MKEPKQYAKTLEGKESKWRKKYKRELKNRGNQKIKGIEEQEIKQRKEIVKFSKLRY